MPNQRIATRRPDQNVRTGRPNLMGRTRPRRRTGNPRIVIIVVVARATIVIVVMIMPAVSTIVIAMIVFANREVHISKKRSSSDGDRRYDSWV